MGNGNGSIQRQVTVAVDQLPISPAVAERLTNGIMAVMRVNEAEPGEGMAAALVFAATIARNPPPGGVVVSKKRFVALCKGAYDSIRK